MGRHKALAVVATILLLGGGASPAFAAPADPVDLPDPTLLACVQDSLGLGPDDPVTEADAADIESLFCENVADLSGIEALSGLRYLTLPGGALTGLTPLGQLGELESLELEGAGLSDLTPLATLTKLDSLALSEVPVSGLPGVAGIASLSSLSIGSVTGLTAEALSFLNDMTGLSSLHLSRNGLTNLPDLSALTSLRFLTAPQNALTSVEFIDTLPDSLISLELQNNEIADLSPFLTERGAVPGLQVLKVDGNRILDISPLKRPAFEGFSAPDQRIALADAVVGDSVRMPPLDVDGETVPLASQSTNLTLVPETGSWTFTAAGPAELTWVVEHEWSWEPPIFSGVITQTAVEAPADITLSVDELADVTVWAGETAAFPSAGRASDGSDTSVRWEQRTGPDAPATPISAADLATYTITSAALSQTGHQFRAIYAHPDVAEDAATNWATLTVKERPAGPGETPPATQPPAGAKPGLPNTGAGSPQHGLLLGAAATAVLLGLGALLRRGRRGPSPAAADPAA